MSAIHYAVDGGHCDTLEYMIQDGANVNDLETTNDMTPLIRAATMNSHADIVLIKYDALLNVEDGMSRTALMIATINGNVNFVKTLVKHGADMYILTDDGKTLYDLAYAMDRKVRFLFYRLHIYSF